ncbi:MAG: hypothetical protein RIB45_17805 [Marivibrio sp.]|uniref:hypothetical protein n=1 Tax=Marivibrio sp. TaxID=2039719 RepID=UPI0032EC25A6
MNYDLAKVAIDAAALMLSLAALAWTGVVWWMGRGRARREEIEEIRTEITQLKGEFAHSPSHDDLQRLHDRVSDVNRNVTAVSNTVAGLVQAVEGTNQGIRTLQRTVQQLVDNELAEARAAKNRGQ